jgi:toluene monooxygenase electron transfer component
VTLPEVGVTDRGGQRAAFACPPDERVLFAGLAAGLALPHECASGTCGTCRAKVVSGEWAALWPDAPGTKHLRGAADEILMCQSAARGPLELALRVALGAPPAIVPCWRDGVLRRIERLTADIATFAVDLPAPMPYEAGQFVLVEMPGIPGARAWSITSHHPARPVLDLLLRRAPAGAASALLFAPACDARRVRVFGPLGRAVFRPEEARPFVAIAGGSGIAGMLSILDRAAACGALAAHPKLFFGLRDPAAAYRLDALDRFAAQGLDATIAFSDAPAPAAMVAAHPGLRFATGLVHEVAVGALSATPRDPATLHFVAGPPPMVDATMRALVMGLRVKPTEIRYDRFG